MSEFRGLHNPERHITTISGKRAMCNWEGQHNHDTWCDPVNPCYCCLAAEVEALRVHITVRDIALRQCAEHAEALRAQVQRVREVAESIRDAADKARGFHGSPIQWERQKVAEDILRILNVGDA